MMILFFLMGACGKPPQPPKFNEFEKYALFFKSEAETRSKKVDFSDLVMEFADIKEEDVVGLCFPSDKKVQIDRAFWEETDEATHQIIVDHELGHCVLDRDHENKIFNNGMPKSIMNEFVISPYWYSNHLSFYYSELFDPSINNVD